MKDQKYTCLIAGAVIGIMSYCYDKTGHPYWHMYLAGAAVAYLALGIQRRN